MTQPARFVPDISRRVKYGRLDMSIDMTAVVSPLKRNAVSSLL